MFKILPKRRNFGKSGHTANNEMMIVKCAGMVDYLFNTNENLHKWAKVDPKYCPTINRHSKISQIWSYWLRSVGIWSKYELEMPWEVKIPIPMSVALYWQASYITQNNSYDVIYDCRVHISMAIEVLLDSHFSNKSSFHTLTFMILVHFRSLQKARHQSDQKRLLRLCQNFRLTEDSGTAHELSPRVVHASESLLGQVGDVGAQIDAAPVANCAQASAVLPVLPKSFRQKLPKR